MFSGSVFSRCNLQTGSKSELNISNPQPEAYFQPKVNKKYHPQIFLDECKYKVKNKKVENLINDDLELTSSDSESDNE